MNMVNVKINGVEYSVPAGITVLEACKYAKIDIPTLCYLKDINEIGACRLCLVEVTGARGMVAACVYPIADGMEIQTNTPRSVQQERPTSNWFCPLTKRSVCPVSVPPAVNCRSWLRNIRLTKIVLYTAIRAPRFLWILLLPPSSVTTTSVSSAVAA